MSKFPVLPPDDLPPAEVTKQDGMLQMELEQSIGKCFYYACDRIIQSLLSNCHWYVTKNANTLLLIIDAPDIVSYWHIVSNIPQLGKGLETFTTDAKVRVYPPFGKGMPFEIGVNEIAAYRDWM